MNQTDSRDRIILNLGCGTKTSEKCVNIDWSPYTRLANRPFLHTFLRPVIGTERIKKLKSISGKVMSWNLMRGLPYEDNSVDAVYHSHFLEHLDCNVVPGFLKEMLRVLRPGGIHRIVVPDLAFLVAQYNRSYKQKGQENLHDQHIAEMFEQCVRREAFGTKNQPALRRLTENLLLGDARKRGETHQWMYDKVNLGTLLKQAEFKDIMVMTFDKSDIDTNWLSFALDVDKNGKEYKPSSLSLFP